jgi:hypothetical protein
MVLFALVALILVVSTALCLVGYWSWPELAFYWQGEPLYSAGMWAQIGLTVFAITLCFFLPTNARIQKLEVSHRRFEVSMDDIAQAYVVAHAGDRQGTFTLGETFEAMKERLTSLRDHPDLGTLEPEILEIAAAMSFASRDLAERYSDERVNRARGFLEQRQFELEQFNDRIEHAKAINLEFKTWMNRIELEENVAAAQMERLLDELERVLPELNSPPERPVIAQGATVTKLPARTD